MWSSRLRWLAALSVALAGVLPLAWMISSSLRQPGLPPPTSVEWIPDPLSWSNYARIFELLPLGVYVWNSLTVVLVAVPITILTASWAAFAMTQMSTRGARVVVISAIAMLLVPSTALWLSRFMVFKYMGLLDTHWALIAPAFMGSSPLFVLLFYWAFSRMPREMIEAARLDGCGMFMLWSRIVMPIAMPTTLVIAVLTFLMYWGDLVSPLLFLRSPEKYTLAIGIRQLQQLDRSNWSLLMAACVVLTVPAVVFFLGVQHYFTEEPASEAGAGAQGDLRGEVGRSV